MGCGRTKQTTAIEPTLVKNTRLDISPASHPSVSNPSHASTSHAPPSKSEPTQPKATAPPLNPDLKPVRNPGETAIPPTYEFNSHVELTAGRAQTEFPPNTHNMYQTLPPTLPANVQISMQRGGEPDNPPPGLVYPGSFGRELPRPPFQGVSSPAKLDSQARTDLIQRNTHITVTVKDLYNRINIELKVPHQATAAWLYSQVRERVDDQNFKLVLQGKVIPQKEELISNFGSIENAEVSFVWGSKALSAV